MQDTAQPKEFYTLAEVAELLGLSGDTARRLVAGEKPALPAFRVSTGRKRGHIRVRASALNAFIEKRELAGV